MAEMIRISEDTDYRIIVLSNQLNLSKGKVIEMLIDSYYRRIDREFYLSLKKSLPLKNKKLHKVCIQTKSSY